MTTDDRGTGTVPVESDRLARLTAVADLGQRMRRHGEQKPNPNHEIGWTMVQAGMEDRFRAALDNMRDDDLDPQGGTVDDAMTPDLFPLYRYRGTLMRTIDGDTIRVRLDLGVNVSIVIDLRIAGINAPEIVGESREAGMGARAALFNLTASRPLYVMTHKDKRSFARWVGDVLVENPEGGMIDVAEEMIKLGMAERVPA